MKTKIFIVLVLLAFTSIVYGQKTIKGFVYEKNKQNGKKEAIPLANIYWQETSSGGVADDEGNFEIQEPSSYPANLIVSFVGYKSDTIMLNSYQKKIEVELKPNVNLDEFSVTEKQASSFINKIDPQQVETLTSKEFMKAACCNISESFETNASVDVNFTDAVSGAKKIQMLGLDGVYSQIQFENLPLVRGLSSAYGLNYIPGTWAESIQIKKGAGSVANGYESITGQINIEFLKPDKAEQLFINGYANAMSRAELNLHGAQKINDKWSTMTFIHANTQQIDHDMNNDNFHDHPLREQYNIFNRWKYVGEKRMFQAGIRAVYEDMSAGQIEANSLEPLYYVGIKSKQVELFTKNGFLFPEKPYKSIGVLNTVRFHEHNAKYGQNSFDAKQVSGYLNLMYQTIINNTAHKIKFGSSLVYDNYDKNLNESFKMGRVEIVPGAFTEYTYSPNDKTSIVAGLRGDYHNTYKFFATPRLHYKYNLTDRSAFRLSAGRGFRTAHPIIENSSILATSRNILIHNNLLPEIAWNYGTSYTHDFEIKEKEMSFNIDYYYTDFENQIVMDIENPREVAFYNLSGESFSHSLQIEYLINLTASWELKAAYKWYDIKTTYRDGLKFKPLVNRNRMLINMAYTTNFDIWKFDATAHIHGLSRIPSTSSNSPENVISNSSETYYTINSQITRAFKHFELYGGAENLFNYRQENPIIAANDPNGSNFDASLIWGPVMGRNIYLGFRYKIK